MARGTATVAYRAEKGQPWLGIPGVASEGENIHEMFKAAKLADWNVYKEEVTGKDRTDSPDFKVIRTNPNDGGLDRLHIAKDRYEVFQNEDVLRFVDTTAFGDLKPVAMGALRGGRQVFMSFEVGDSVTVKGTDDEVQSFLHVLTSHDASWAFGICSGNMRLACQNMLRSVRSHAASTYKIRHTSNMSERVEIARAALGVSLKQQNLFLEDMAVLADAKITEKKFWEIVHTVYPKPKADVRGAMAKWDYKMGVIAAIDAGPTVQNLKRTGYRAYNVLNEHNQWYSTVRAGDVEGALVNASGWDDVTNKKDVDLYRAVLKAL